MATDSPVPDIGCGYFLGDTSCVRRYKHDGDHEPAETVLVDRQHRPVNRRYVRRVGSTETRFASVHQYKGREEVWLGPNHEDDESGTSIHPVNRPAVRVDGRWFRRHPGLEVVEG